MKGGSYVQHMDYKVMCNSIAELKYMEVLLNGYQCRVSKAWVNFGVNKDV